MNAAAPVVALAGVTVLRHGQVVLEDISFEVGAGEFAGICGPNGAGKTTLLKAMLGILPIAAGRIEVLGEPPDARRGVGRGVGYVPQRHAIPAGFPATVLDVVLMGDLRRRRSRRDGGRAALEILERVGLGDLRHRLVGRLSGGQQRRVVLAQALCASERLLILDEPTVGLDLPAEQEFYALVRRLQHDLGLSVIVVSHDLVALAGEADRLYCINRRMHVHGHPEDVVHSHALREAYSCEFDFLAGEIDHHGRHGPSH
jgi:ABC-type Mn2+/Zn2+ transport system ATPase subunit